MINVLLVDDAKDFVEYTEKRLRLRKINVFVAHSGKDALAILKRQDVDVVVLDVLMPGMDGVETLEHIKRMRPEVKVIMLSGHGSIKAAEDGIEKGALEYLLKPCEFDDLLHSIESAYAMKNE